MTYTDLLGTRYKVHGRSKQKGFDCYGLVIEVLKRNGIDFPDLYYDSIKETSSVEKELKAVYCKKLERPEINCVVEITNFNESSHIGVYIGEGLMIHTTSKTNVVIEPLKHYENRIKGYYKVNC